MAALTAPITVKTLNEEPVISSLSVPVKASTIIYGGATVAIDASGYAVPATAATGLKVVGIAEGTVDNSAGTNGAKWLKVYCRACTRDVGAAGDALAAADWGATVYAIDDHTVGKTNGSNSRSPAGIFLGFETDGTPYFLLNYQVTKALT